MKKCVVSIKCGNVYFEKVCEGAAETYETVEAIIESNKDKLPNQKRAKEDYFYSVVQIFAGTLIKTENIFFKLERIDT